MFGEFLNIIVRALKLDKSLYKESKYFGEAGLYFAGLIMILDGVAGAVAANTCLLYTSPSPRDKRQSRMPSSA